MTQRILVIGASGFIGRHLIRALADSGWAVPVAASRRMSDARAGGVESVRLDVTDPAQVKQALDGASAVVNCMAGDGNSMIAGARAVFGAAAAAAHRPRVVHLSSMAVYGSAVGDIVESAPAAGLSPYGAAKLAGEALAPAGHPVVILRPGIVYGPGSVQWSGRIADLLDSRRLGDLGRAGDGCCNLVYVGDVVEAVLRSLRTPAADGCAFNLSMSNQPTWNEYFIRYAKMLGAVPVHRITARRLKIEGKLFAPPLKIAEIALRKLSPALAGRLPQVIPPSLIGLFAQDIRLNVRAVEEILGLSWKNLDDGMRDAADWHRRSPTATHS